MTSPVTIINDCALSALRTLRSNSVDCIITSPPYWGLRDYGIPPTDWPACSYIPMPGLDPIQVPAETSCLGLEPTLHAFLAHITLIFNECRRVLKPTGSCWVNMGDSYAGSWGSQGRDYSGVGVSALSSCQVAASARKQSNTGSIEQGTGLKTKDLIGQPWRVAFALQASGWYLRQDNIWHKPNPMPESIRDRATKSHEYVFHLTKSERYYFDLAAWAEPASEGTHPRRAGNGIPKPSGWATESSDHSAISHNQGTRRKPLPAPDCMTKNNASMDASLSIMPLTRNKRSVWTVPTVAYSEAHYATYPPRLITPPMLATTSAKGCCSACGKPWGRIVEKTDTPNPSFNGSTFDTGKTGTRPTANIERTQKGERYVNQPTDHWQPTCACSQSFTDPVPVIPAVVLDIFGGSGTTAQVALEHVRHAILIERGPHNIALIHKRLSPFLAAPVLPLA
jgi:DNA modification methylase